jgi:hypothetical protein
MNFATLDWREYDYNKCSLYFFTNGLPNIHNEMKIFILFDLTIVSGRLPLVCRLKIYVTVSWARIFYRHELVDTITLIFFEQT